MSTSAFKPIKIGSNLSVFFAVSRHPEKATRVQRLLNNLLRLASHKHALICGYESQRAAAAVCRVQPIRFFNKLKKSALGEYNIKAGDTPTEFNKIHLLDTHTSGSRGA
jgi:hypothetical protein